MTPCIAPVQRAPRSFARLLLGLILAVASTPSAAVAGETPETATPETVTIEQETSGEVVRNPDGSVGSTATKTWTGPNGSQIQAERTGTVTRDDDGNGYARDAQTSVTNPQTGDTNSFSTTGSGSRTVNEDGSTSYERTRTTVNEQTGATRTIENQATVTKTESGASISQEHTRTGPNGGTVEKSTTGSVTQAEDGTRTWQSSTDGTATGPSGAQRTWGTERQGSSTLNEQGGRDRNSTATTTLDNGKVTSADRSSSTWRDGEGNHGYERRADRVGPNGGQRTAEGTGSSSRTADGRAFERHGKVTRDRAGARRH
jgi:hypothetical protein